MSKPQKNEVFKDKNINEQSEINNKKNKKKNNTSITDMDSLNSDSSSNYSNEFNQNFFKNEENNMNTNYTTNTETNINTINNNKQNNNNYISKNTIYESNIIPNIIEENNNNSSYKFSFNILKYLNIFYGSNNTNNNNNENSQNNQNNSSIDNTALLNSITSFINDKFLRPDLRWIINSNSIKILKTIGFGGSSDVYLGDYRGTEVAVKKLRLLEAKEAKKDYIKEYKREVSSLVLLYHPYLVLLMGAIAEPFNLSIVTEYCKGGNLFELLYKKPHINLSWELKKKILLQIAIGMNYLHTNDPPVLHRDLKSLNILLTDKIEKSSDTTDIKISDFGLSRLYQKSCILTGHLGTCYWMAPEIIVNKRYSTKVDVYSYGIIIWEVCTRKTPYSCMSQQQVQFYVSVKKGRPNLKIIPSNTPPKIIQLMQMCWDHDPDNRPSFEYIVDYLQNLDV